MKKKITESTAYRPIGNPANTALMGIPSGEFAGRRVVLMMTGPNTISLSRSDAPGTTWSSLQTVADDAADYAFDCRMTPAGDIHVVYSEQGTNYLVARRLTFDSGSWSVGAKVTIYNGSQCFDPSLVVDHTGTLWVSWSRFVSPSRWIQVKSSVDGGSTWGSGPSDAGDQVSSGSMFANSRILGDISSVHVIYHDQDTALFIRSRPLTGGDWSSPAVIATGSGFTAEFDAAVGPNGIIGIVYSLATGLYYCEYDGIGWSSPVQLHNVAVASPQLKFEAGTPVVIFLKSIGVNAFTPMCTTRRTGAFSEPVALDAGTTVFDAVTLESSMSGTLESLTSQAASTTDADVYHSATGCLLRDAGDAVYLGMDARFHLAHFRLSEIGMGGTLEFSYYDGAAWQPFAPAGGQANLGATDSVIVFWPDSASIAADWQKCSVGAENYFWIRIAVASPFSTGPLAGQITAVPLTRRISLRR